ncbi:hypothetical protein NL676_019256 [Syzygium grande]|nr:hypothetical protein NL676_019256 [Syzygium grande]
MAGGRPGRRPDLGDGEVDRRPWARPLGLPQTERPRLRPAVELAVAQIWATASSGGGRAAPLWAAVELAVAQIWATASSGGGRAAPLWAAVELAVAQIWATASSTAGPGSASLPTSSLPSVSWPHAAVSGGRRGIRVFFSRPDPSFSFLSPTHNWVFAVESCRSGIVVLRLLCADCDFGSVFNISKILVDKGEEEKRDPSKPYSLGPRISDWDEQRAEWLRNNPDFPNFIRPNKPRVLLITGSCCCRIRMHGSSCGGWTVMLCSLIWRSRCRGERYKDSNFVLHVVRDLLDVWPPMGPKGKIREEAGKILTRELKDRPVFEADDQSAMVYLLATQRDGWGEKGVLGERLLFARLLGNLVDRYEEMIENYHPGLGDHRWPLVTHFVGCKPCGKFGDYPVERCLKQMDRAFNFGDNQILQMYGFTHKSLASRRVKRIRNETGNPLEVKDELGLLHPAFKAVKASTS